MSFSVEIRETRDIPGSVRAHVDKWSLRKSLLETAVNYFKDPVRFSLLPQPIQNGSMPLFLLDADGASSSGKALVNPYIAFKVGATVFRDLMYRDNDKKEWREGLKKLLQEANLWNSQWQSGRGQGYLTMFSGIAFGQAGVSFSSAAQTAITETMQAVACAARQVVGRPLNPGELAEICLRDPGSSFAGQFNEIYRSSVVDQSRVNQFEDFINRTDAGTDWVASSAWIANTVKDRYLAGHTYKFYRQDQYPAFKNTYTTLKNAIMNNRATPTSTRNIFRSAGLAEDKWNPADIIAVKNSFDRQKDFDITKVNNQERRTTLSNDLRMPGMQHTVKAIDSLGDLYVYNKWVDRQFEDRNIVPISLKRSNQQTAYTEIVRNKDVQALDQYSNMDVDITSVEYLDTNQKCIIHFTAGGKEWYFDARGFEQTAKIADIQIQLSQDGSTAAHGKVTLPVTKIIARLSGAKSIFNRFQSMRRRAGLPRANNGFMDFNIIRNITNDVNSVSQYQQAFANYIQELSSRRHRSTAVIREVDSNSDFRAAMRRGNTLPVSKYFKHKVQSYEVGYMLEYNKGGIRDFIKKNVAKSMYLYAGSKGFMVFGNQKMKAFMQSSTYVKAGGT